MHYQAQSCECDQYFGKGWYNKKTKRLVWELFTSIIEHSNVILNDHKKGTNQSFIFRGSNRLMNSWKRESGGFVEIKRRVILLPSMHSIVPLNHMQSFSYIPHFDYTEHDSSRKHWVIPIVTRRLSLQRLISGTQAVSYFHQLGKQRSEPQQSHSLHVASDLSICHSIVFRSPF